MRIRDVRFPDGSVFLSGTDADVEKYGRCIVDLGNMLAADDQLLGDRESDALVAFSVTIPKLHVKIFGHGSTRPKFTRPRQ
jgi:hypothetical protein